MNPENVGRLLGLLTGNTEDIVKQFITDPEVLAFFNMLTCTYCYTTAAETPGILSAAMFVDNHEGGIFYPCGSTQMLSNKLEKAIEERGGRVITRHMVEEILISDGKAWGVTYQDGLSTAYGWVAPEAAPIHDPQFCRKPTDVTYSDSPYRAELSTAKLVKVKRTTTVDVADTDSVDKGDHNREADTTKSDE